MLAEGEEAHATVVCAIEATPREVDAGAGIRLTCTISCSPARDLRGQVLLIKDQDGAPIGEAEILAPEGETSRTGEIVLRVPDTIGDYTWTAVLPAHVADRVAYEECSTDFSFAVKPHATSIVIWDVPHTIEAGESFGIKVGVKCSSECHPAGWTLAVFDHEGALAATSSPGAEPWPGTAALYFAEVEMTAPRAEGLYRWKVRAPGSDPDIAHAERVAEFGVRIVPQPEYVVRVEAIDRETQAPVRGAKVVVHPYRAFTDASGVAELRVAKGEYNIFVSGKDHIPFRVVGAVTADMTIRANLALDVGLSDADIWS